MNRRQHVDTEPKATGARERKERPVAAALVWVLPLRQQPWARDHERRMPRGVRE